MASRYFHGNLIASEFHALMLLPKRKLLLRAFRSGPPYGPNECLTKKTLAEMILIAEHGESAVQVALQ